MHKQQNTIQMLQLLVASNKQPNTPDVWVAGLINSSQYGRGQEQLELWTNTNWTSNVNKKLLVVY